MSEHAVSERGVLMLAPAGPRGITGAISGPIASYSRSSPGRDVAVRYKQTVAAVACAVVRPFLTVLVFTVVFGRLAKLPSEGEAPYPLTVFAGMPP
jgi:hypothetical protein